MFFDKNLLNIVKRAGNMSEADTIEILNEYLSIVLETVAMVAIDYIGEKENIAITNPKEISEFLETLPALLEQKPDLAERIKEALFDIDLLLLKKFRDSAPPGDIVYMEVYLYSKIKELEEKIKNLELKEKAVTKSLSLQDLSINSK